MRAVTAGQMREIDRLTIASGVSGATLMDRAGYGLACGIKRICSNRGLLHPSICMLAGKGNNGGDVFAAAYHLHPFFKDLRIILVGDPEQLQGETHWHCERVSELVECWSVDGSGAADAIFAGHVDIVVDGLLGTGFTGTPREPLAGAIREINRLRAAGSLVVAVDLPSGMCADTGVAAGDAVMADFTFTMGLPKRGMLVPEAQCFLGSVDVVDIGIAQAVMDEVCQRVRGGCARLEPGVPGGGEDSVVERLACIAGEDVRKWLPPRPRVSHKGDYGKVLLVGGAPGFSGAIAMAAKAAARSGAGLVHVLAPASVADRVASQVPEAMVHAGAMRPDGGLAATALHESGLLKEAFDGILLGPGMTCQPEGAILLQVAWDAPVPVLVLDADALRLLALGKGTLKERKGALVLTPHPGEAGGLLGVETSRVQADRRAAVQLLALQYDCVVVLKGAGTVVADGKTCWMNLTGNPGMASGGSGDVLAGMVVALPGQCASVTEAACCAVYVHGVAGDLAALSGSQIGVTATGILDMLPRSFGQVLGR
jgi:ADP-dependent NAD(P)H-hydrate dehydratase / NAD(P)H-hydrate epimerase